MSKDCRSPRLIVADYHRFQNASTEIKLCDAPAHQTVRLSHALHYLYHSARRAKSGYSLEGNISSKGMKYVSRFRSGG